jgi:hypothetical protein
MPSKSAKMRDSCQPETHSSADFRVSVCAVVDSSVGPRSARSLRVKERP